MSIIITDDWPAYKPLRRDYLDHKVINHSAGPYVDGDVFTNTIEGFFGNLKTGMRGAYKHVSPATCSPTSTSTRGATTAAFGKQPMFDLLLARAAGRS